MKPLGRKRLSSLAKIKTRHFLTLKTSHSSHILSFSLSLSNFSQVFISFCFCLSLSLILLYTNPFFLSIFLPLSSFLLFPLSLTSLQSLTYIRSLPHSLILLIICSLILFFPIFCLLFKLSLCLLPSFTFSATSSHFHFSLYYQLSCLLVS